MFFARFEIGALFESCFILYLDEEELKVEDVEQELLKGKEEADKSSQEEELPPELSLEDGEIADNESKTLVIHLVWFIPSIVVFREIPFIGLSKGYLRSL